MDYKEMLESAELSEAYQAGRLDEAILQEHTHIYYNSVLEEILAFDPLTQDVGEILQIAREALDHEEEEEK